MKAHDFKVGLLRESAESQPADANTKILPDFDQGAVYEDVLSVDPTTPCLRGFVL